MSLCHPINIMYCYSFKTSAQFWRQNTKINVSSKVIKNGLLDKQMAIIYLLLQNSKKLSSWVELKIIEHFCFYYLRGFFYMKHLWYDKKHKKAHHWYPYVCLIYWVNLFRLRHYFIFSVPFLQLLHPSLILLKMNT